MQPSELIWMNGEFVRWEDATVHVLTHGLRTPDLAAVASETPPMSDLPPEVEVGTREMTDAVLAQLAR